MPSILAALFLGAVLIGGWCEPGVAAPSAKGAAKAPPRIALVIGNAGYRDLPALTNPVNDAQGMEAALKKLGFSVTLVTDANLQTMKSALKSFGDRLSKGAVGLVYYSGHGVQVDDHNYLIPIGGSVRYAEDVPARAIDANQILEILGKVEGGTKLFILDACRNNELLRRTRTRVQGLARMAAPSGTLIAYATGPNRVASDGFGNYSLYTSELLKVIGDAGQRIENVFYRVRVKVGKISSGNQVPVEFTSLTRDFYFLPPTPDSLKKFVFSVDEIDDEYITLKKVNIRKVPRSDSAQVGSLAAGKKVTVTGRVKGSVWFRVEHAKGKKGYVIATFLRKAAAARKLPELAKRRVLKPGQIIRDCPKCPEMVVVPGGAFTMGSSAGLRNERPTRRVELGNAFAIGKFEVTFDEWAVCAAEGGCRQTPSDEGWGKGKRPVTNVTWDDAREFTKWLSRKTRQSYALPSEAQWEYAARAGTASKYWWGDKMGRNQANCSDCGAKWSGKRTAPVGSFKKNAFGLHDVHGNVWEWVEDCWHGSYRGAPKNGTSWMTGSCRFSVLRGGSWQESADAARVSRRGRYGSAARSDFGFRVARVVRESVVSGPIAKK